MLDDKDTFGQEFWIRRVHDQSDRILVTKYALIRAIDSNEVSVELGKQVMRERLRDLHYWILAHNREIDQELKERHLLAR